MTQTILRTSLDKRSDGLRAVFTGSSREGLKAMFSAREAPFFHFLTSIDLPALGQEFVDHCIAVFKTITKRDLDKAGMVAAFTALHENPFFYRRLLDRLLLEPKLKPASALNDVRERIALELRYPETWIGLSDIQRATALILAQGETKPFSNSAREIIGQTLGENSPSAARVQAALRKLEKECIADNYTGGWAIKDPMFVAWILERSGE